MTINAADFRQFVIAPALAALAPAGIPVTKTAADLLMATAAMEAISGHGCTRRRVAQRSAYSRKTPTSSPIWSSF